MNWLTLCKTGFVISIIGWKYRYIIRKKVIKTVIILLEKKKDESYSKFYKNWFKGKSTYTKIGPDKWKSDIDNILIYSKEYPVDVRQSKKGSILMATVIHSDGTETEITNNLGYINHNMHTISIPVEDIYSLCEYESIQFVFSDGHIIDFSSNKECVSI